MRALGVIEVCTQLTTHKSCAGALLSSSLGFIKGYYLLQEYGSVGLNKGVCVCFVLGVDVSLPDVVL